MTESKNTLPLGSFTQHASTKGYDFTIRATIDAVRYDAGDPGARTASGRIVNPLLYAGVETVGRTIQAVLSCVAKGDKEGAHSLQVRYLKMLAAMADLDNRALQNLVAQGVAFPRIIPVEGMPAPLRNGEPLIEG